MTAARQVAWSGGGLYGALSLGGGRGGSEVIAGGVVRILLLLVCG